MSTEQESLVGGVITGTTGVVDDVVTGVTGVTGGAISGISGVVAVSYTHLRAHET